MTVTEERGQAEEGFSGQWPGISRATVPRTTAPRRSRPPWRPLDGKTLGSWVTLVVVVACVAWVLYIANPSLLLTDTTPTGGDMGSHVWGPAYLEREVLPDLRLSGWTPDWYAGFPAFQFYMVVPALIVVALHVGVHGLLLLPALVATLALTGSGFVFRSLHRWRRALLGLGLALLVLVMPIPYNIAFKLVTVLGLATLPVAAWAFGRLAGLRFPTPALLSVGSLFFLFNLEPRANSGTGNIIGGNFTSTMAGEFAFSISLSLALVYLGVLLRGLRTGRHRPAAAVLLALTGLCHLIPAFFALLVTIVALGLHAVGDDARPLRSLLARLRWLLPVGAVAALLSAFWTLPFLARHSYFNDMGWEPLPHDGQSIWGDYLTTRALWGPLALAGLGLVLSIVHRHRAGIMLAVTMAVVGAGFIWLPETALWNARVLPFYYLSMFLLGALGVGELLRSIAMLAARDPDRPHPAVGAVAAPVLLVTAIVAVGLPLGQLPGQDDTTAERRWGPFVTDNTNPVASWARWNYSGLERKEPAGPGAEIPEGEGGWPEYDAVVDTMAGLGADPDHGCGRAFWEYDNERLNTYGTPMALMMLPYFTDGCIGSMEGLYFESSATTPFHFLTQCQLSTEGSCAQRDLPYAGFDIRRGVSQLQLLGVRYYMAVTPEAIAAAGSDRRLTEVEQSGPWHIYEVAAAPLVTGLEHEPAVLTNVEDQQTSWLGPAALWYMDPTRWSVPLATSGPDGWQRVAVDEAAELAKPLEGRPRYGDDVRLPDVEQRSLPPVEVSDVNMGEDTMSFRVDRPGTPVLVKMSYFPNWEVAGAEGPYRVTPNLMVVVPTDEEVTLSYGRTGVDWLAIVLTGAGLVGLVLLIRAGRARLPRPKLRRWPPVEPVT